MTHTPTSQQKYPCSIIVAIAHGNAIGAQGNLVATVRDDMRRFRTLTMGHAVVMGRKTFESLPKGALPGRRNIVVTRNPGFTAEAVETAPSLGDALRMAHETDDRPFVIGGGEIYRQAIDLADSLYVTWLDTDCRGADTFFPEINPGEWEEIQTTPAAVDSASGIAYRFADFHRIEKK